MELVAELVDKPAGEVLVPLLKGLVSVLPELATVVPYRHTTVPAVKGVTWSLWTGSVAYGLEKRKQRTVIWRFDGQAHEVTTVRFQPTVRGGPVPQFTAVTAVRDSVFDLITAATEGNSYVSEIYVIAADGTVLEKKPIPLITSRPEPEAPEDLEGGSEPFGWSLPNGWIGDSFENVTLTGRNWHWGLEPNLLILKHSSEPGQEPEVKLKLLLEDHWQPHYIDDHKLVLVEDIYASTNGRPLPPAMSSLGSADGCDYYRAKFMVWYYRHLLGRESEYIDYTELIPLCKPLIFLDPEYGDGLIRIRDMGKLEIFDFRV